MTMGARFAKWGLGFFVFGVFLTFGVIGHYCAGASSDVGELFRRNVTLWWACPWTLSVAIVQGGGLGVVAIGLSSLVAGRAGTGEVEGSLPLTLCTFGLLGVFAVGYPGYFVFNSIWPAFYYRYDPVGKNAWLLGQAFFFAIYFVGILMSFNIVRRALDALPGRTRNHGWKGIDVMSNKSDLSLDRRSMLLAGASLAAASALAAPRAATAETSSLNPQPLPPSPEWARALPSGPDARVKVTEAYAAHVARDAYFWAWPLVNTYNRRLAFSKMTEQRYAGPLLEAPLNRLTMLTDYVNPEERNVACPNQDVVYGLGMAALDVTPVVVQVPDFGDRFWVYQIVDLRTDSFVQLGKMYGTTPGFYLLVGPDWNGEVPKGVTRVFRASSKTALVAPRIAQDDTPEDKRAIQGVLTGIAMYPLAEYDGRMKRTEWSKLPRVPGGPPQEEETRWVLPERFFDELPTVLADAPPLPGEEARYAQVLAIMSAAKDNPKLKQVMIEAAKEADEKLVTPLFQFRNYGQQLPHNWSTISNESAFGTDYFTRTAVAKSNILVNSPNETKYFYQDLDSSGARLNDTNRYTVTFAKDGTPPVNGFWSLSIYNQHHFFIANPINRFSVGTKNKDLRLAEDGSLTIYVQSEAPAGAVQRANWLPAPKGDFSLYIRAYWPKAPVTDGSWTPPAVQRVG